MKLFMVTYQGYSDVYSELMVDETKEDVESRAHENDDQCYWITVVEITEVDGHKIIIK